MRVSVLVLAILSGCSEYNIKSTERGGATDTAVLVDTPMPTPTTPTSTATPTPTTVSTPVPTTTTDPVCPTPDLAPGEVTRGDCTVAPADVAWGQPVVAWTLDAGGMVHQPVVGQLTDDNGDGRLDELDGPDVVALTHNPMVLHVLDGATGSVHWTLELTASANNGTTPALGDVNGDGWPDVVVGGGGANLLALDGRDGTELWNFSDPRGATCMWTPSQRLFVGAASLADLDGDGTVEVVAGSLILDGRTGALLGEGAYGEGTGLADPCGGDVVGVMGVAADLDLDGVQEVIVGNARYDLFGSTLAGTWDLNDGYVAVADLDLDGDGELIAAGNYQLRATDPDLEPLWSLRIDNGYQVGPPTVADLLGTGAPHVVVQDQYNLSAWDGAGGAVWSRRVSLPFASTTAVDLDGDGAWEVLAAWEDGLHVLDGATGDDRLFYARPRYHSDHGAPVAVDVDGDGQVEILLTGGHYAFTDFSLVVLEAPAGERWAWGPTRYHQQPFTASGAMGVDGHVPRHPRPSWTTTNSFRATPSLDQLNGPTLDNRGLPDPVPRVEVCDADCDHDEVHLVLRIGNAGAVDLPAGTVGTLYSYGPSGFEAVASMATEAAVPPGSTTEGVEVVLQRSQVPMDLVRFVVDDDRGEPGLLWECAESNNRVDIDVCGGA
jgi:outer membrane protein assembly factor BamB